MRICDPTFYYELGETMKTQLILFLCVLFVSGSLQANPYPYRGVPLSPPVGNAKNNPAQLLEEALKRMREFLAEGGGDDPAQLYTFLDKEVSPHFDFDRMAALVARPFYQRMTEKQQRRFRNKLKESFLRAVARQLGTYRDPQPRVDFSRPQLRGRNTAIVNARISPATGYPVRLSFRFYRGKEGWKVVDASNNGISAVHFYRQQYLKQMRRSGRQMMLQ
jgi:phospholipid transport system substrate-binding protein